MESINQIKRKNGTYYLFNDMINIKNFDSSLLKIDKNSYKSIDIYYIGYITMKDLDYVNFHSVNPLYFIIGGADGYMKKEMEIST